MKSFNALEKEIQLQKIAKGVYRYDPENITYRELEDFTQAQKEEIIKRDGYRCVQCGKFKKDGVELHVDHIIAKDNGGRATIENGQTLCASCNFTKKNYGQTESGKKMFIRFYELSKKIGDTHREEFPNKMLEFYDEYNVNGHIEWKK